MYDRITNKHRLKDSSKVYELAKKYHEHYKILGGIFGWDTNIRVDFMIIACASLNGLNIVYSNDKRTMFSEIAIHSYRHINAKERLHTPNFLIYNELLEKFRRNLI